MTHWLLTAVLLPPTVLLLVALSGALLAWRGWRKGGLIAAGAILGVIALATPRLGGSLVVLLEGEVAGAAAGAAMPAAIVVLGAEVLRDRDGHRDIGPLSLERLRTGAALHRATGLPLLVTGGLARPGEASLAALMAASLSADFGVPVRWQEEQAADTRENAVLSAALLRAEGIGTAYLVTHGWHMPRALEAFGRTQLAVVPAPVPLREGATGRFEEWVPRPDQLVLAWYAVREWAGRLIYVLRDGGEVSSAGR